MAGRIPEPIIKSSGRLPGGTPGRVIKGPWKARRAAPPKKPRKAKKLPECITLRTDGDPTTPYRVRVQRARLREFSGSFASLEEAKAARDTWIGMVQRLRVGGVNDRVTVQQAIDAYRKSAGYLNLSDPGSCETRLVYWEQRLGPAYLADLHGPVLAAERDRLVAGGTQRRDKPAPATVCGYLSALSCAWDVAVEAFGAPGNQLTTIKWPRIRRERPRKFTEDQVKDLLKRADGYKAWAHGALGVFIRINLMGCQRKITNLSPQWFQVDLERGSIEIPETKNRRAISIVIEDETLTKLRAYHKRLKPKPSDYVFQSPTLHQPIEPKKHLDWLFGVKNKTRDETFYRDARERRLTLKHLRSTSLSRLFTHMKCDVPRAMSISGHKTARVLLEDYAHADSHENRALIRKHARTLLCK